MITYTKGSIGLEAPTIPIQSLHNCEELRLLVLHVVLQVSSIEPTSTANTLLAPISIAAETYCNEYEIDLTGILSTYPVEVSKRNLTYLHRPTCHHGRIEEEEDQLETSKREYSAKRGRWYVFPFLSA